MAFFAYRIRMFAALFFAAVMFFSAVSPAAAQSHLDTPLMVVRFNQPRLNYQQSLYNVLGRALEAKPDVFFNIIALVPQSADASVTQKLQAQTQANAGTIVGDMVRMGIPQNRLRVSYQRAGIEYPEVHIFVQ